MISGCESRVSGTRSPDEPAKPPAEWYASSKRGADLILAIAMLVLSAPLMLLAMLLVRLTSRGPAIYSQTRLGHRGRPYTIYKIRTMVQDCESRTGATWATAGDPRVTPAGRFLRRTHLDELPQLWNVLRGEMSLVGPRPERPEFAADLGRAVPCYEERLSVLPGITGLAQVQLPPDSDLEDVRRKLACDLYYAREIGFWLDLRILLCTATKVVGVPFTLPGSLLRMPSGKVVEVDYESRAALRGALAQQQPA
jgi:lipopolysaccharide/colanic/teichoic acid biosynthesis glycosyltransferase